MAYPLEPIRELSFPDEQVMTWAEREKSLEFSVSGAHCLTAIDSLVLVQLRDWDACSGFRYMPDKPHQPVFSPLEPLREICEAEFSSSAVVLRGFGAVSGHWLEYTFVGTSCRAYVAGP